MHGVNKSYGSNSSLRQDGLKKDRDVYYNIFTNDSDQSTQLFVLMRKKFCCCAIGIHSQKHHFGLSSSPSALANSLLHEIDSSIMS